MFSGQKKRYYSSKRIYHRLHRLTQIVICDNWCDKKNTTDDTDLYREKRIYHRWHRFIQIVISDNWREKQIPQMTHIFTEKKEFTTDYTD